MNLPDKIIRFAQRELDLLKNELILPVEQGYFVFGQFSIQKENSGFSVIKKDEFLGTFSSAKVALSYCIAERAHNHNLSIKIQQLDQHYLSATNSLNSRKLMANRCRNSALKEILHTKIQHRRQQQYYLENQLEDCVKMAKYFYLRGLNNETHRTRQATPIRSSH